MNSSLYYLSTLDQLKDTKEAIIVNFTMDCPVMTRSILYRYGFTIGSRINLQFKNHWGDLLAVKVQNSLIALRKIDAQYIQIKVRIA